MKLVNLSEIFDIQYGVNLELNKCELTEQSGIPFVSRTANNNGVSAYIERIENCELNKPNTISVACGGSVLSAFYHGSEYYSGRDIVILSAKKSITKQQMLIYCTLISANKYRYNYGRQANKTLGKIKVPDISELPDNWRKHKAMPINTQSLLNKNYNLESESWMYFLYEDLFDISKGKSPPPPEKLPNKSVFLVSASGLNNGVGSTIKSTSTPNNKDLVTVSSNGAVGDAFYQNNEFFATGDVNILIPKFEINPFIGLFLITIISKEKFRFNYGRKWGSLKMLKHKIKLPTKDNQPDWEFMENYIKSLDYSKMI